LFATVVLVVSLADSGYCVIDASLIIAQSKMLIAVRNMPCSRSEDRNIASLEDRVERTLCNRGRALDVRSIRSVRHSCSDYVQEVHHEHAKERHLAAFSPPRGFRALAGGMLCERMIRND
jgi:hypothetical protein